MTRSPIVSCSGQLKMELFEICGEFVIRAVEMAEPQYIQGYSGRGVVGAGGLRCD